MLTRIGIRKAMKILKILIVMVEAGGKKKLNLIETKVLTDQKVVDTGFYPLNIF